MFHRHNSLFNELFINRPLPRIPFVTRTLAALFQEFMLYNFFFIKKHIYIKFLSVL